MELSKEQLEIPHKQDNYMYKNRIKWAISNLYYIRYIDKLEPGFYELTENGISNIDINPREVDKEYRERKKLEEAEERVSSQTVFREPNLATPSQQQAQEFEASQMVESWDGPDQGETTSNSIKVGENDSEEIRDQFGTDGGDLSVKRSSGIWKHEETEWRNELIQLLENMDPIAFERLCQRILREGGFTQVEVTGRSGDGGIDGIGVVRISGFLSFKVLFQCKRWKNAIGPGVVRDFRGAMTGRTEKGLIMTTGSYTTAAMREATRDGAPEIDLVDGKQLLDKLKELGLGVMTEQVVVEKVTVDPDFFANI